MASKGGNSKPVITEDMRAAAEVATSQWNDYQTRLRPFEEKFIADMTKSPTVQQDQLRGRLNADLAQQTLTAGSVPPGQQPGPALMRSAKSQDAVGKAAASGYGEVTQGELDRSAQGMSNVVALGRGQAAQAMQTQQQLAESSADTALTKARSDQQSRFAKEAMTANLIGSGVGAATAVGAYGANQGWFNGPQPVTDFSGRAISYQPQQAPIMAQIQPVDYTGSQALSKFGLSGFN